MPKENTRENTRENTNWLKFSIGLGACLLVRLLPLRAPNLEPILAVQMPFAKNFGQFTAFLFGILSILAYDVFTGTLGYWSIFTALAYGALGILAYQFFKNKAANRRNFFLFAIFGTLFYDAVTGLMVGPLLFHQSLVNAFYGQIPFTLLHLAGNLSLALLLSPLVHYLTRENFLKNESVVLARA